MCNFEYDELRQKMLQLQNNRENETPNTKTNDRFEPLMCKASAAVVIIQESDETSNTD